MNAFARGLFQLLIGWMRDIASLWDGDLSGVSGHMSWLNSHWLGLAAALVLIGTAIDFAVWFFRWRPDRVWRGKLNQLRRFSLRDYLDDVRFRRGYGDDNTQIMEIARPAPLPDLPPAPDFYGDATAQYPVYEPAPASIDERDRLEMDLGVESRRKDAEERRRRSDRHRRQGSRLRDAAADRVQKVRERVQARKLERQEEDDMDPDTLPPIMKKEEAFRAPVYPRGQNRSNRGSAGGAEP